VLVADVPDRVQRQYETFVRVDDIPAGRDSRGRLTSVGNNGRLAHWDVAVGGFRDEPLLGTGAGTYEQRWALDRPTAFTVLDAHSLYAEVLGELGLPGLLLLLAVLGTILGGLARRLRDRERAVNAALLACVAAWVVHAGVDWDWELPAVSLWVFAAGGLALARPLGAGRAVRRPTPWALRGGAAVAVAGLVATPVLVAVSQLRLDDGVAAAHRDDCPSATRSANGSLDLVGARPEPYEVLAWCALREGRPLTAVAAMASAVVREPGTARLYRGLALTQAAAGGDPRRALRTAYRLDPRDAKTRAARRLFADRRDRADWPARGLRISGELVGRDGGLRPAARRSVAAGPRRR
jgi:hypothetical protein